MSNEERNLQRLIADAMEEARDGTLDAVQLESLRQLLVTDAEARRLYLEHNRMSRMLASEAGPPARLGSPLTETKDVAGLASPRRHRITIAIAFAGWATAAAVLIAFSWWSYSLPGDRPGHAASREDQLVAEEAPTALVTNQIDVVWMDDATSPAIGDSLKNEWLRPKSGVVQVEFSSGARVALEGPAELRLVSELECFLQQGKLTVLAPPEASRFTVKSPTGNVIDLGTEFGVVVDSSGRMDVHVLDGEVEVEATNSNHDLVETKRLLENEAAFIVPRQARIEATEINRDAFDPIRYQTLLARKPLKIQFDCGVRAGVYQGTQSPAHASGDLAQHEQYWNPIIGDRFGRVVLADGSISPAPVEVDYGRSAGKGPIDWNQEPELYRATKAKSRGVFATPLGEDNIHGRGNTGALRFRGLPAGAYRVYFIGRSTNEIRGIGNNLALKAFQAAVGVNRNQLPDAPDRIAPLDDPDAKHWVEGQTHLVAEVELSNSNDYLTVMTRKDRDASPNPKGGNSPIVAVQIIQLRKGRNP
ncbi:MAG: FecR family protein [Planctomycetales bacterium]